MTSGFRLPASLRAHADADAEELEVGDVVGVGVNGAFDAEFLGVLPETPVHIEAIGVGIDLDDFAVLRGSGDNLGHIDGVAFAFQQDAARGMAEDRDPRVRQGFADAFWSFFRRPW